MVVISFCIILIIPVFVFIISKLLFSIGMRKYFALLLSVLAYFLVFQWSFRISNGFINFILGVIGTSVFFALINISIKKKFNKIFRLISRITFLICFYFISLAGSMVIGWQLGDYYSNPIKIPLYDKYVLEIKDTGNFSDYQCLCEIKEYYFFKVIPKTVDSKLLQNANGTEVKFDLKQKEGKVCVYKDKDIVFLNLK